MSGSLPTVVTPASGLQPQAPADLNAQLIAQAQLLAPGLTATLPGSLVEDMSSTATGALIVIDQARVDFVASLSPNTANPWLLVQLGAIYGVPQGTGSNTGVNVVFSGAVGYVVSPGFTVGDGTYQYVVQTPGGVIGTGGSSQPLSALATQSGSWAVPANTVTGLVTGVPSAIGLTVTNPLAGTPGGAPQTEEDYRAQVLQAGLVGAQGTPTYLKTLLNGVTGVQSRLVSVRQQTGGGWEVIVGGSGDPVQIGYAVWYGLFTVASLVGSIMNVTGITNANPAVVTVGINHGYVTGQIAQINGATGLTALNGVNYAVTVLSQATFSVPVNTTASGTYTGNGVVTPNFRNTSASIYDYPDTYTIPYVLPPQQTVTMVITWNTTATGIVVSPTAVAAAVQPAIALYVNSLPVGQPINVFELQTTFQAAVSGLIPGPLLTRMVFAVSVNGVGVAPTSGTGIIPGDPESYFYTVASSITVNQG